MKTKPQRLSAAVGLAAALLSLAACNSTTLETAWKAPEVDAIHFTKVLVLAAAPEDATRRAAEDAMKDQITSVPAVVSYQFLTTFDDLKDRTKVAKALKDSGADGLVVMRTVSNEQEVSYTPGGPMPMPYRSFWGYYSQPYGMHPMNWEQPTVTVDRVIGVETNIYDGKSEALIWSGFTKTTNPGKVDRFVVEVAEVVRNKLRQQKLIP